MNFPDWSMMSLQEGETITYGKVRSLGTELYFTTPEPAPHSNRLDALFLSSDRPTIQSQIWRLLVEELSSVSSSPPH